MEEDFQKIGIIKEDRRDDAVEVDEEEFDGEVDDEVEEDVDEDGDEDETDSEEEDVEEDIDEETEAMVEALEFHEDFQKTWDTLGEEGVETVSLDDDQMVELESFASESISLPLDAIGEDVIDDDELDEEDESDEDDEDDEEVETDKTAYESVTHALHVIENLMAESDDEPTNSLEEAVPAFANIALIAEHLYGFFMETAEQQEDDDYVEIANTYKSIAKYAAGVVDTLKTEDIDTIDQEALNETFQDYLKSLLQGLETYSILREMSEDDEDEGEDEDEEVEEQEEGNE